MTDGRNSDLLIVCHELTHACNILGITPQTLLAELASRPKTPHHATFSELPWPLADTMVLCV